MRAGARWEEGVVPDAAERIELLGAPALKVGADFREPCRYEDLAPVAEGLGLCTRHRRRATSRSRRRGPPRRAGSRRSARSWESPWRRCARSATAVTTPRCCARPGSAWPWATQSPRPSRRPTRLPPPTPRTASPTSWSADSWDSPRRARAIRGTRLVSVNAPILVGVVAKRRFSRPALAFNSPLITMNYAKPPRGGSTSRRAQGATNGRHAAQRERPLRRH